MNTIPNCYYLQTHLNDVLANWEGGEVEDGNTSPGQYLYWLPTDPAYGCYNDLATVTATNFNAGPSASVGAPGTVSAAPVPETTVTATLGTVGAATVPATTVTAAQPAATSGQSNAELLQECAPGCGKSQCTFSDLVSAFLF